MSHDPEASPTDPLLETGSYIEPGRSKPPAADAPDSPELPPDANPEFLPGVAIAAEPISMYVPGEEAEEGQEATPPTSRRRNPEEMSKRPNWLPEDWRIDLRVRASGATAGQIDRYYVEPTGQRRFRSRVEVLHFLETGSKPKRKSLSETDTIPAASPASQKKSKSSTKRKKSNGVKVDNVQHT